MEGCAGWLPGASDRVRRLIFACTPTRISHCKGSHNSKVPAHMCAGTCRFQKALTYLFPVLRNGARAAATPLMAMVWSTILPGPVTTVLNRPSPPNSTFLTPFTI